MELLPNVKDPVVLRDQADREYVSRVENLGASLLVVARPHDLPDDEVFETGTELGVVWADSDGVVRVVPTRIMAEHADGTRELWSLFVTGSAFTAQRRRHVRVPADGPVALLPTSGDEIDVVAGSLVDVSEGAVRCTVEAGSADGFLMGSNHAIAEFRFGSVDFALPGRVESLRSTARPAEFEDLVVVFDEPIADVEALREQIFTAQVQEPEIS